VAAALTFLMSVELPKPDFGLRIADPPVPGGPPSRGRSIRNP
jgi:hypothetical protein